MDNLFLVEKPSPVYMNKEEYFERTQQLFRYISMKYSNSWQNRRLLESEFPDESICNKCKGCGNFQDENGDVLECRQHYSENDAYCYHRYWDAEDFGTEVESQLQELHNLLCVEGFTT
jgi:hypothetical protein